MFIVELIEVTFDKAVLLYPDILLFIDSILLSVNTQALGILFSAVLYKASAIL
ncbi:MAG: hypothetical protein LBC61_03095 [Candidatus Peribacteria bacterium]|nr:hypothetical protein [Candidatus Peribacteria bacterium]